jgi:DNA mismatch repair protein MutS
MMLRPFKKLATRILNQDNLWAGLSSFAVEMSELREILAVADDQTLVLGDELCAGTESISGTAIVAAGIQHLYKAGSRFVLATHLHDLMKLPKVTSLPCLKIWHLHVEYNPIKDLLIYHRTLREGPGSTI